MVLFQLPPHPVERPYRGGERIAHFRRVTEWPRYAPEEWLASTTTVHQEDGRGLSRLADGRLLRDLIAADPSAFLAPDHLRHRGPEPGLLVKLLDAGQRLPVHYHPDDNVAREQLRYPFGKTEAWFVVHAEPGSVVWLGFRRSVSDSELSRLLAERNSDGLLDLLVEVPVQRGDTFYVPSGTPHAIGEGVLIVELQQASDLSVLLEWWLFGEEFAPNWHLGLGQDGALRAIDHTVWDGVRLQQNMRHVTEEPGRHRLFPEVADRYFRGEYIVCRDEIELGPAYQLLIVVDGQGIVQPVAGEVTDLRAGDALLAGYAAGALKLLGQIEVVRCLPGLPE